MAEEGRSGRGVQAAVLAGAIIGGILISPVGAHVGKKLPHLRQHLDATFLTDAEGDAQYLGQNAKAADSDKLDGLDSTAFVQGTAGKAADSDLLDGLNSTDFLRTTGKAADADKLDDLDSTAFLQPGSALTGVFSCPGAGFYPYPFEASYDTDAAGGRYPDAGASEMRCAVHLPHGATVTGASFNVGDTDGATNVTDCGLVRTAFAGAPAEQDVSTLVGTTGTPGKVTIAAPSLVAGNASISNSGFAYSLECRLVSGTSSNLIYGAFVTYTVPASAG